MKHSSLYPGLPAPVVGVLSHTAVPEVIQPNGWFSATNPPLSAVGLCSFSEAMVVANILAVLQLAHESVIRTEQDAGQSLLPSSPYTYASAHDSTTRTALGHAAAAAHSSTRAVPGVPASTHPVLRRRLPCSRYSTA